MSKDQMHIALLSTSAGNHQGAWRRPNSGVEHYLDPKLYLQFAKRAETACIDAIFFADVVSFDPHFWAANPLINAAEPLILSSLLAGATERIGLVSSVSTTFSMPYTLARQFAALDLVSGGRSGWNLVTSAGGEKHYGLGKLPDQDERYAQAEEFLEAAIKLWDSWTPESLLFDRQGGRFADPNDLRRVVFNGRYFSVEGYLNVPRPPQGRPVIFQAGSSPAGRDFAARHAEGIFTAAQTLDECRSFKMDMHKRLESYDRDPASVKILAGVAPIIGKTESEAKEVEQDLQQFIELGPALHRLNAYVPSIDLTVFELDKPLPPEKLPPISNVQGRQSRYALFRELAVKEGWTLRQLLHLSGRSDGHWSPTGSAAQVSEWMSEWFKAGACDGFIFMPTYFPNGFDLLVDDIIPDLQSRGIFRTEYKGSTLRSHFGLEIPSR